MDDYYRRVYMLKILHETLHSHRIDPDKLERILDLGCGNGYWLRILADLRGRSSGCFGTEIDLARLEQSLAVNPGIAVLSADHRTLPFKEGQFDLVTDFVSFHFLLQDNDLSAACSEVYRILKPGGWFLSFEVVDPDHRSDVSRFFHPDRYCEIFRNCNFSLLEQRTVFRKFKLFKKHHTAYLASVLHPALVMLLDEFCPLPHSPTNKLFLFQKA